MSFALLRSIINQVWAIDPTYVEGVTPFLVSLLNGENVMLEADTQPHLSISADGEKPQAASSSTASIPPGSIAIVRMSGPMMKNDQFCGPQGTATIGATLKQLAANPNVDGIILQIDSPGGTVDGTEDLARIFGGIKKPKLAYVDGLAASAAMWVASAADEIMLNGQTAMVGSIGTMTSFADMRPVLEKAGVKFHMIRASKSVDKNADFEAALSGQYDGYVKNTLDPLNAVFTSTIEKNRAGKINLAKEDVLTGKMYIGKAAIKAGLADSMGSLDDAVAAINNRIKQKKSTRMSLQAKYPNLAATAQWPEGAEALENGSVEMTADELARTEQAIADGESAAANLVILTKERDEAQAELATAQQALADAQAAAAANTAATENETLKSEIANLKSEIVKLGGKVEAPAETKADEDPQPATGKARRKYAHEELAESFGL